MKDKPRMFIYCRDPIHERPRHALCKTCKGKELIEVEYQPTQGANRRRK